MIICAQTPWNEPMLMGSFLQKFKTQPKREVGHFNYCKRSRTCKRGVIVSGVIFPVDPWAPSIDSQSIASQLFAVSLFPYLGFLYFITKSNSAPKLTLFGFYFLLAFVGATMGSGFFSAIITLFFVGRGCFNPVNQSLRASMLHYGTSLSNVDWLHGGAESLLTLTNLFIVLGLRKALKEATKAKESQTKVVSATKDEKNPMV